MRVLMRLQTTRFADLAESSDADGITLRKWEPNLSGKRVVRCWPEADNDALVRPS